MSNKEEFDYFIGQMLENAVREFKATAQYKLLREKLDQMERDCDTMFTADEKDFATECFELIMKADDQEEYFVYQRAFRDCISMLKWVGLFS